jgi:hypothetical protein
MLAVLRNDLDHGRWNQIWPPVPPTFLDRVVSQTQTVGSGGTAIQRHPT